MVSTFQDGDKNVGHGTGYGPSSHNGDLQGVINSLDYIRDLGFNAIWMTPIFDSRGTSGNDLKLRSTGYYPTNYFDIDPNFGTNDKFRELVQAAHKKGIYVILDGVFGHHGGLIPRSPNGNKPTDYNGKTQPVRYPESLEFYKEVAQYWIENYEIDGWRLDLAKELVEDQSDGHNYLADIRQAVEDKCDERRQRGETWGILGYVVGEYWDSISPLNNNVYNNRALKSAFDFPFRYNIVQGLAQNEYGDKNSNMLNSIWDVHRTPKEKTYCRNDVYPNLFIDNHDTFRFGNLLRLRHGIGVNDDAYWNYHKIAIGTLAAYSGPITLYYGDEIGDITDCWNGKEGSCQATSTHRTDFTSSARTDGHISGFNSRQTNLHDFTKAVMNARLNHPSMWRGTNGKTKNGNVYFNCKYDPTTGDKVVFVTNFGNSQTTVSYEVGGVKLYDFFSKEVIYSYQKGKYNIYLEPLGTRIFQVFDEDIEIPKESTPTAVPDCAAAQEVAQQEEKEKSNKQLIVVIVIAGVVVVVVIVIAIAIIVHMKRKYEKELQETKSNPLVDMSLE